MPHHFPSPRFPVALVLLIACLLVAGKPFFAAAAIAGESPTLADFFGHYEGRSLFPMGEARNREFVVTIAPHGADGFIVEWATVHDTERASHLKTHRFTFVPATTAPDVFVAETPPLTGGDMIGAPLAWAKRDGATLTVHVMTVVETGDYVVQTYVRTLTPIGLSLEFTRVRSGVVERTIKGTLKRLDSPAAAIPSDENP